MVNNGLLTGRTHPRLYVRTFYGVESRAASEIIETRQHYERIRVSNFDGANKQEQGCGRAP